MHLDPERAQELLRRYDVDPGVCDRQCVGAGFERRDHNDRRAAKVMSGALQLAPHPVWATDSYEDWAADPFGSRNWQFQFHALRWLSPVRYAAVDGSEEARRFWLSTVRSWIEHNSPEDPASTFSWVDMADGLRAQELVFGWPLAQTDEDRALLLDALETHGLWLADEAHLSEGNHALHQNIGLFVLACFLRREDWQETSLQRLRGLFSTSFDETGANDEGAVEYHQLNRAWWARTWQRVEREGIEIPDDVERTLQGATTFMAHATRPNGTLTPLGDSHLRSVAEEDAAQIAYVATAGRRGSPPSSTTWVAPNGYVFGRSGWGDAQRPFNRQSHYSLRFGPKTNSHQHEDRGGLTFFANGVDWLTDPGSYNYEPKDEFRRYLRSREAHNLLTVPGVAYDPQGHVRMVAANFDDAAHDVTLQDDNYDGVRLTRRTVYLPGLDLMVVMDAFEATTQVPVRQIWHTDSKIKPRYRDSALELQHQDGARLTFTWLTGGTNVTVQYGEEDSPREWVSRKWGERTRAAGFQVSQTARRGFFTAVFGDCTGDTWSVVSSRSKRDFTWMRVLRFGALWTVLIDADGVSITSEAPPTEPQASARGEELEMGVLRSRLDTLENRLALLTARQADSATVQDSRAGELEEQLAAASKAVKQLTKAHKHDLAREHKRVAALLPLLPADLPRDTILGGADFADYLPHIEDPLYVFDQWQHKTDALALSLTQRRRLAKELYARGYWVRSLEVLNSVLTSTGTERDRSIVQIRSSEIAMMRGQTVLDCAAPESFHPVTGRVLHVVGKAIPETQTGYTLRTHYLAQAQALKGFDIHVFRQAGGVPEAVAHQKVVTDGVTYHLPEGPPRGTLPWDEWLQLNVRALAELVTELRPSVLHCHSDFVNHMIAHPVARAFGLPLVYESRGFWEESWLSRIETKTGRDLTRDHERYGLPDAYTLRREREDQARALSDRVTTLADVMKQHIVERGEESTKVSVTPNGVQPDEFPMIDPDLTLKRQLGIPRTAPVIGYITSVVEYEGIDTLLSAFAKLREAGSEAWLLLVGDGPVRAALELQAKNLGLTDRVIFTGRVPHEAVLNYYSLIDVFVVPRKNRTVCRLVTPLKPFEAFSTGRTVVVSDVDALREIADQSGAAATFTANDADDLVRVIEDLLASPAKRRTMAVKGAQWVRQERSWGAIADLYDAPYEQVGVRPFEPVGSSLPGAVDAHALRHELQGIGRDDALQLLTVHSGPVQHDPVAVSEDLMDNGWASHGFEPVHLPEDFDWTQVETYDRTWQMYLHSWEFIDPLLEAWRVTGEDRYLLWAVQRATRWGEFFTTIDTTHMAWYDMAVAYRSVALQGLIRATAASTGVTDEDFCSLLLMALRQRDAHWQSDSFNPRNNHGYYSAVSQLVLARALPQLPGMAALRVQSDSRLRVMTTTQFLPDGGHAEHSPEYHRMLLASFEGAIRLGAIDDPDVVERITKAAEVLGWMILPHGGLLQMGDSAESRSDGSAQSSSASSSPSSSAATEWILSDGARGSAPTTRSLLLPHSGYGFVRHLEPGDPDGAKASYLAMTAGFHSRTHKHCDDQSVVWFESGQEILIDGGRYRYGELLAPDSPLRHDGFYYADPIRQYMESCAAHTTLSLDGGLHDRRRTPYGAGLSTVEELEDGGYRLVTDVPHSGWRSQRTVLYHPGQRLVIDDEVTVCDDDIHTLHSWFLLDGGLGLEDSQGRHGEDARTPGLLLRSPLWHCPLQVRRATDIAEELTVRTNRVGETWQETRGLRSREDRKLEPAWSLHWAGQFSGTARVRTEFVFDVVPGEDGAPGVAMSDPSPEGRQN